MNFDRNAGELHFAIGIRSSLKIQVMKSAETVSDVDLHGRVIHRLGIDTEDRQLQRTRTHPTINDRDLQGRGRLLGWRALIRLSLSDHHERDEDKTNNTCSSVHIEQLYGEEFWSPPKQKSALGVEPYSVFASARHVARMQKSEVRMQK